MRVHRGLGAERSQDEELARRVREVVRPAHHVRDAHVAVVHSDRQVVEGAAVRAGDHEVVDGRVLEHHLAADHVLHGGGALVGDPQPHRALLEIGVSLGHQPPDLLLVPRPPLGL